MGIDLSNCGPHYGEVRSTCNHFKQFPLSATRRVVQVLYSREDFMLRATLTPP